MLSLPEYGEKP